MLRLILCYGVCLGLSCCAPKRGAGPQALAPVVVTDTVRHDPDDPAIWYNAADPANSLVIGTDKGGEAGDGALYAFGLDGKARARRGGLRRPNNVAIVQGLAFGDSAIDLAVCTERYTHKMRFFALPSLIPVDEGGIVVFDGEAHADPMGIATYQHPERGQAYAIVGRKTGPTDGTYLWQYALWVDSLGHARARLARKFGAFSGKKEIEAIAVDAQNGYVYYADEGVGIRKYHADPARGNAQLALFGTRHFRDDQEGISLYAPSLGQGYLLVSDQQANRFHVYPSQGAGGDPHHHPLLGTVALATLASDGNEATALPLGSRFPNGLLVAMSDDGTFHYYDPQTVLARMVPAP